MPSQFLASSYAAAALWQGHTKVKYQSNPKSGKSFDRYARYEKSSTIEESLENGSKPADLLFDYEKGLMTILGPLRKAPLDPFEMKPQDFNDLSKADMILIRYGCRHDPSKKKGSENKIMDLQKNLKELSAKSKELKKLRIANRVGVDSTRDLDGRLDGVAYIQRLAADREAKGILAELAKSKRMISEHEVLRVLDQWGFAMNPNRINVMKDGAQWVHSDTIGGMSRRDGLVLPTPPTPKYPNFVKVITRYLEDHMPKEYKTTFCYTSININKDYAGARHRDQGNQGPSFLKAFGNFSGGHLRYFPGDARTGGVDKLLSDEAVKLDAGKGLILFDGNRAHEVDDFKGSRYSLVFFTCRRYLKMPAAQQKVLTSLGIKYPNRKGMAKLQAKLETPEKCGAKKGRSLSEKRAAKSKAKGASAKLPGYGYWPRTKQQLAVEETAKKVWKNRPLIKPNVSELQQKRKSEVPWTVSQQIPLGPDEAKNLKHLILHGYNTIVDAVDFLVKEPKKTPKNISKAGYCVVYTYRTKSYYVVYQADRKEAAMKAAGASPDMNITEAKATALQNLMQRVKKARLAKA